MWRGTSALLLGLLWPQSGEAEAGPEPSALVLARIDRSLVLRTWKIRGVMSCGAGACLRVENAWPCGLLETTARPGHSAILEAQPAVRFLPHGARHNEAGLRFAEARAHIWIPAPPAAPGLPLAIPPPAGFSTSYLSELDLIGWRNPWWDLLWRPRQLSLACERKPQQEGCAGAWGPWFPRTGFLQHPSEPKAAMLQALRAGRAASDPSGRIVLRRYPYEPRRGHWIQMARPVLKPPVSIGGEWDEKGSGSRTGSYLFVHFGLFEGCNGCLPTRLAEAR